MTNLKITNTLSRTKELFKPINNKNITMYACGPTVYDTPHVGNARSLVVFDLLFRVLKKIYGDNNVTYVRNITDIDDKIIDIAKEKNLQIDQVTKNITKQFHLACKSLNCLKPTFEPMMFDQYKNAHPELRGLDCGIDKFFDKYINVYGVTIAAMPKTPVPEIIHAAKVYAQLIDNDENFHPDDIKIYHYHQEDYRGRNSLIVLVDNKIMDNKWIGFKPGQKFWVPAQALRPGHSGVGHSRDGEMDISVEEMMQKQREAMGM